MLVEATAKSSIDSSVSGKDSIEEEGEERKIAISMDEEGITKLGWGRKE